MRDSKLPGHWTRVENRVEAGTPDVNYCFESADRWVITGWIELKSLDRWLRDADAPVKVDHFTKQQRFWLRRRCANGGRAHLLLRVDRPQKQYLLLDGTYAADRLGEASRNELLGEAVQIWGPKWNKSMFLKALEHGLKRYPN